MDKLKKCTVCGREFLSERGIEVCSEECRAERKHRQNVESNYRRYNKKSNELKVYTCQYCGEQFEGLARRYCSETCREAARKEQVKEYNKLYYKDRKNGNHKIKKEV